MKFKQPFQWVRSIADPQMDEIDETWNMNPNIRYVMNANTLVPIKPMIEGVTDLKGGASLYNPLNLHKNLANARIRIERYRDRGLGDLLFMTGPIKLMQLMSGNTAHIDFYTLASRGGILFENPDLSNKSALFGPSIYDSFGNYDYHWLVESVTEFDEEKDQLNVYDALYRQLGIDPSEVDPTYKRPYLYLNDEDMRNLDSFFFFVGMERRLDLRKTGYYVMAPNTYGSLRSAPYGMWLEAIQEVAKRRPVVVTGIQASMIPDTDMSFNEFNARLNQYVQQTKAPIINMIGRTPARVLAAMISKSKAVVSLDSAPLYIAEALRVPAVSLWGPHHPAVRIGYDQLYMETSIWKGSACPASPCFSYDGFPKNRCPMGENTTCCEVLRDIKAQDILAMIEKIEMAHPTKVVVPKAPRPEDVVEPADQSSSTPECSSQTQE